MAQRSDLPRGAAETETKPEKVLLFLTSGLFVSIGRRSPAAAGEAMGRPVRHSVGVRDGAGSLLCGEIPALQ